VTDEGVLLVARYDQGVIEPLQMARLLRQLGFLINELQMLTDSSLCVRQLDTLAPEDRAEIESWNSNPLQTQNRLVHSETMMRGEDSPNQPAVVSWDGEWTYSELTDVSSRLASHFRLLYLGQEQLIIQSTLRNRNGSSPQFWRF
jgi:non-ribosomal peptide synthetase component F